MRLVKQRDNWDCGIAVVAMLTGVSYANALDIAPKNENGLSNVEVGRMLRTISGRRWRNVRSFVWGSDLFTSSVEKSLPGGKRALLIRPNTSWRVSDAHWIASDDEIIYDPEERAPLHVSNYVHQRATVERIVRRYD